jgi:predicted amidophosphoribosyltransferase
MGASTLLDLVLPRRCACCGASGAELCAGCRRTLPRLDGPMCARCGAPTVRAVQRCRECNGRRLAFAAARAAVAYDDAVRRLVAAWKERGLRGTAYLAAGEIVAVVPRPAVVALAFVPPDRDRTLWRGYHPSASLARALASLWELPVLELLTRTRSATRQRGLALAERRLNVSGAFAPHGRGPPRVALVDDVYTSGATVNAAASALRKGGVRSVEVVTFARAVRW